MDGDFICEKSIHLDFPATEHDARVALDFITSVLRSIPVAPAGVERAELALAEVFNNIVEHAYAPGPPGHVRGDFRITDRFITCVVEDDGKALPDLKILFRHGGSLQVARDALPEGGFGWGLIRDLVQDIQYSRRSDGNRLQFLISVGASA